MIVEGLVFAGMGSADSGRGYGSRYRHVRAPDGRRLELLDRRL